MHGKDTACTKSQAQEVEARTIRGGILTDPKTIGNITSLSFEEVCKVMDCVLYKIQRDRGRPVKFSFFEYRKSETDPNLYTFEMRVK